MVLSRLAMYVCQVSVKGWPLLVGVCIYISVSTNSIYIYIHTIKLEPVRRMQLEAMPPSLPAPHIRAVGFFSQMWFSRFTRSPVAPEVPGGESSYNKSYCNDFGNDSI